MCRKRRGEACTSGDCSGTDVCLNGTCQPCRAAGSTCGQSGDCCGDNECKGGVCSIPCTPGARCMVPGQQGPCAVGQLSCTPTTSTCVQTVQPSSEVCDGIDNDCNGVVDNITPTLCTTASPSGCQANFSVNGMTACVNGAERCEARRCDPSNAADTDCYCTTAGAAAGGNGKPCGEAGNTPCIPGVTACTPSSVCAGAGTNATCQVDVTCPFQHTQCWAPKDVRLPPDHCYAAN